MATAFAVYSATDNSLNFYKRDTVPSAGSTFEGKVATAVYSNIETSQYASYNNVPWYSDGNCYQVTNVTIVDTITPISTAYWFHDFGNMNSCDVNNLDTSKVTNMANMFFYSRSLTFLNVSHFKTNNVTNMTNMFNYCSSSVLDVSNFDTSKVTDMSYMFQDCANVTSLDLSNFDTSKVTNMDCMFISCSSLNTIYVSDHWNTNAVTSSNYMFSGCTELKGDIAFNSSYADKTYATYTGGYFTYRPTIYHQDFLIKGGVLYDTAEAIREKTGGTEIIKAKDFPAAIAAIPSGGGLSVAGTYFTGDANSSGSYYYWGIYSYYSSIAGKCIDLSKCELGKTYLHLDFRNGSSYSNYIHCMYPNGTNSTYMADMKLYDKNGNEGAGSTFFLEYGIMYYKFRVEKGTIANGYDVYDADTGVKICTNAIRLYGAVGYSMAFLLD